MIGSAGCLHRMRADVQVADVSIERHRGAAGVVVGARLTPALYISDARADEVLRRHVAHVPFPGLHARPSQLGGADVRARGMSVTFAKRHRFLLTGVPREVDRLNADGCYGVAA